VLSVAGAAWAFDRLAITHFGPRLGRRGALVFAAGTLVQVAVGRLPFLLGEALGLLALLAAHPRANPAPATVRSAARMATAVILAAGAALASPLAGAFVALAALAWLLGALPRWSFRAGAILAAASLPVIALELLFPGQGSQPFAPLNLLGMLIALGALAVLLAPRERTLRIGLALYAVAVLASYLVPSALGGNVTRLGSAVGLGLLACVSLGRGRTSGRRLAILAVALVPLLLAQWSPALPALAGRGDRSISAAFFQPLLGYLLPREYPLARVEVVPTARHWEADYVASRLPLARGWERQLDTHDNPIFYRHGLLTATTYRRWLVQNGVRYVALADVQLDYAGVVEGRLVRAGITGLTLVWHDHNWRVYKLAGTGGILQGAGQLLREHGSTIDLTASRPGRLLLRVHYSTAWHVDHGDASLRESLSGWITVLARRPGRIALAIKLPAPF
jgi:hypothetical protein